MLISDLSDGQLMMLVLPILPNMWALKHCFHHDFPTEKEKQRWMMACVFLPCIGGLAYILVGRKHASKETINVFERYGKKDPGQTQEEQGVIEAVTPVVEPVEEKPVVDEPLPEGRARAPWDDEPADEAEAKPADRPVVKDWDFGCPDDVRKN